jgi:TonB family protein
MRNLTISALAVLLSASLAHAQAPAAPQTAYRWVDERGVVHWAQSIHLVPEKYAGRAVTPDFRDTSLFPQPGTYVKPPTPPAIALTIQHHPPLDSLTGWWSRETRRIVTNAWKGRGQEGQQPVLSVYVTRNGEISVPEVERSSGDFVYDLRAREAITRLRLPPLPPDYPGARLRILIALGLVK